MARTRKTARYSKDEQARRKNIDKKRKERERRRKRETGPEETIQGHIQAAHSLSSAERTEEKRAESSETAAAPDVPPPAEQIPQATAAADPEDPQLEPDLT